MLPFDDRIFSTGVFFLANSGFIFHVPEPPDRVLYGRFLRLAKRIWDSW